MEGPILQEFNRDHSILENIPQHFVAANYGLGDVTGEVSRDFVGGNYGLGDVTSEVRKDPRKALVYLIEAEVKQAYSLRFGRECCIFRVHEKFHKMNDGAYTPEVASIGPLHRGKPELQAMEQTKLMYMHALLYRTAQRKFLEQNVMGESSTTSGNIIGDHYKTHTEESGMRTIGWLDILEDCVSYIESIEEEARKCYSEDITLERDEFVRMMVTDGLFIIELFWRLADDNRKEKYDPLFCKVGDLVSLYRDLFLLENQIPMLVLTGLFQTIAEDGQTLEGVTLNLHILHFFSVVMKRDNDVYMRYFDCESKHLLDFFGITLHPSPKNEVVQVVDEDHKYSNCKHLLSNLINKFYESGPSPDSWRLLPSVTEMKQSGVKFKKGSTKGSFLDIKFNNGVLEIPPISLDDNSEFFFRNLMAFEQCADGKVTYISSYAALMDCLIDSAEDVRILCSNDIIQNHLGSDEEASTLFNNLSRDIMARNFHYSLLYKEINAYCSKETNIWRATLKRDYFNGPWAIISFFGAILLLLLTLTSTIFAIIPVVRPS